MKTSCTCLYCYQSYNHKPNCSGDRGVFRRTLVLPSVHINFITRERERERESAEPTLYPNVFRCMEILHACLCNEKSFSGMRRLKTYSFV